MVDPKSNLLKLSERALDIESLQKIIPDNFDLPIVIDLSPVSFFPPWGLVGLAILLCSLCEKGSKFKIILPRKEVCHYLQRMHLGEILEKLDLKIPLNLRQYFRERNPKGQFIELHHLQSRSDFYSSTYKNVIPSALVGIGLPKEIAQYLFALIAELVDNMFLHNLGQWPLGCMTGGFICMQNFPSLTRLDICVGDLGQGIKESFSKTDYRGIMTSDEIAIGKVLEGGYTSRPQSRGGDGLRWVSDSTKKEFKGVFDIRSGVCHIQADESGQKIMYNDKKLVGTIIQLTINY